MKPDETVRSLLKELFVYNTLDPDSFTSSDETGTHKGTVKDLQELNYGDLAELADLLGMSDLYLDDSSNNKGQLTASDIKKLNKTYKILRQQESKLDEIEKFVNKTLKRPN